MSERAGEWTGSAIRARITRSGEVRGSLVSVESLSDAADAIRDLSLQGVNLWQRLDQAESGT